MKNILILAYDFQPLNTIGANRVNAWFKYFKKFGLNPIVFTRKWETNISGVNDYLINESGSLKKEVLKEGIVYRSAFSRSFFENINYYCTKKNWIFVRKVFTLISGIVKFSPYFNLEKKFYLNDISRIIKENKIDIIIASGEPFILFKFAHILSKKYKIPYVLDYRDSWSQNPTKRINFFQKIINKIELFHERKYLSNANFFITVSDYIAKGITSKVCNKQYQIIENGFDLDSFKVDIVPYTDFTMTYLGSIYEKQPISTFAKAISKFIITNPNLKFKINFVGILFRKNKATEILEELSKRFPNRISIYDKVSLKESIKIQKKSSALLKFSIQALINGFYGGKLYEYYACNLPILNFVKTKDDAITDFFSANKIQKFVYDEESFQIEFSKLIKDFNTGTKSIISLTESELNSFSRESQCEKLVSEIKKVL